MKKTIFASTIMLAAATLMAVFSGPAMAKVTGRCDNCHTMHNSQDGSDLYAAPYETLLKGDCVGCHTGTNNGTNTIPYVMSDSGAPTFTFNGVGNTLAGGNFWWVAQDTQATDPMGHNVFGIASQDRNITSSEGAPGAEMACGATSCHATLSGSSGGCEGCHTPMHHANDGTGTKYVSASPWYRFLSKAGYGGHPNYGVIGIEDADWQASVAAGDHNEYKGITGEGNANFNGGGGTMTGFCAGCHGEFHSDQTEEDPSASPWIRHPSDFVIPNSGEYASMSTVYNPDVPVARPGGFGGWATDTPSGTVAAGTDMVMCLSCHVAHGSPYDDMLRWDYADMLAGDPSKSGGCFVCHTAKNN